MKEQIKGYLKELFPYNIPQQGAAASTSTASGNPGEPPSAGNHQQTSAPRPSPAAASASTCNENKNGNNNNNNDTTNN